MYENYKKMLNNLSLKQKIILIFLLTIHKYYIIINM